MTSDTDFTDDDDEEEMEVDCRVHCRGKIHHATEALADIHASHLGADAYSYPCDHLCEWVSPDIKVGLTNKPHWHVASSPIPRRWRLGDRW
jgi:hypothetical protein